MKTKAIVAILLVAAAANTDARFAWLYPRKALSPDESEHWIVINSNARPHNAEFDHRIPTPTVANEAVVNDAKLLATEQLPAQPPSK